jgi:hypothetical protein
MKYCVTLRNSSICKCLPCSNQRRDLHIPFPVLPFPCCPICNCSLLKHSNWKAFYRINANPSTSPTDPDPPKNIECSPLSNPLSATLKRQACSFVPIVKIDWRPVEPLQIDHRLPHPEAGIPDIGVEVAAPGARGVPWDLDIDCPRELGTESVTLGLHFEVSIRYIMVVTNLVAAVVVKPELRLFDSRC